MYKLHRLDGMQSLKGKFNKVEDLLGLVEYLRNRQVEIFLSSPLSNVTITINGDKVCIKHQNKFSSKLALKKFLEDWIFFKFTPAFELKTMDKFECSEWMTREELLRILKDPYLKRITKIPTTFLIKNLDSFKVPATLTKFWINKEPLNIKNLYDLNVSIADLVRLIDGGDIRIVPINKYSFLFYLPVSIMIAITFLYALLPHNLDGFTKVKLMENMNWALKDKIINDSKLVKLPVEGCFKKHIWLKDNKVVSSGFNVKVGVLGNATLTLPEKGYKPFFSIPVR